MNNNIILAPLQGFTDAVFRDVYAKHFQGIDQAVAPFISTMGEGRIKPSRIKDVHPDNNKRLEIIPQILGNNAQDFIFLAKHLSNFGYNIFNWNMGCPHSKIAKKNRGSGMLSLPGMVDELLDKVMNAFYGMSFRLSVKVRLGRNTSDDIFALLPVFEKYPIEEIIVHPRTGVQIYKGKVDLDAFDRIAANTSHRLVYNGDITCKQNFHSIKERFPAITRFMIGRGVLANPFLPSEIKGLPRDTSKDLVVIKAFHDELFEVYSEKFYGPAHVAGRMKGFWSYLGPSFKGSSKLLKRVYKSRGREQYRLEVEKYFAQKPVFSPEG